MKEALNEMEFKFNKLRQLKVTQNNNNFMICYFLCFMEMSKKFCLLFVL